MPHTPIKALFLLQLAAALLIVTLCVGTYVDIRSHALNEHYRLISTAMERIRHKNDALTTLTSQSVLGRDILLSASYDNDLAELNASLVQVQRLANTEDLLLSTEIMNVRSSNDALRQSEQSALEMVRAENWRAASSIFFNAANDMAIKLHAIDSEIIFKALRSEMAQRVQALEWMRKCMIVLRVAGVVLLLWAGRRYSQRMHADLSEQTRLRTALTQANQSLESKVQQRTLELELANNKLATMSLTDALTDLPNRRNFDATLEREWLRAQREGHGLALGMIDVDWFKAYNDRYGHPAGDACLQSVARALHLCFLRSSDMVARYGGEEFVFLAPATDIAGAKIMAERVVQTIRDLAMPHEASPFEWVTVSVGIASSIDCHYRGGYANLLEMADHALYEAKQAGRNCWIATAPLSVAPTSEA